MEQIVIFGLVILVLGLLATIGDKNKEIKTLLLERDSLTQEQKIELKDLEFKALVQQKQWELDDAILERKRKQDAYEEGVKEAERQRNSRRSGGPIVG